MASTTTTTEAKTLRKTPRVGNTTSKRKNTKTVTIKKDVTKDTEPENTTKTTRGSKTGSRTAARTKATKTLSTTQLTQRVSELENTVSSLIEVLNSEFRTEMLQGPRGVSKALKKAGLVKDS